MVYTFGTVSTPQGGAMGPTPMKNVSGKTPDNPNGSIKDVKPNANNGKRSLPVSPNSNKPNDTIKKVIRIYHLRITMKK